ncbi:TPA: GNAT family N-acetyltransferase [Legionella pneumophila]|uniref:GNAT family N-acetyltransferase n=1 Tax=Legionella pneumophila TaxID=446 RepID=UPI000786EEB7|nr:GNAT family N-acetyltransferase [Legionella pneumophila]HAU1193283.1 GNAT family N-acetyltransferase [Legionella pneumophila]HBD7103550.1 GNAT family N-acetyltransferase [Legionella pneumophila]HCO4740191.1 GNAT family N-acetyltransferase [Legionella pneumophila]HDU7931030.1 GNAT family N-acetyltransferase [Legionella pneumophila]HDU7937099.1 GNAT family N-acetyltransferase [Legionella pneumophila]
MAIYKFEISTMQNGDIQISARHKSTGEIHGYVQLASSDRLESRNLLEIDQLYVDNNARGHGLGSELASRAIKYALKMDKGIHMMIQPGSDMFWKKYFNSRFDGKRITLFGGETLNTNLADGKVFEISKESLVANYKFPQDKHLRDRDMERICTKLSN